MTDIQEKLHLTFFSITLNHTVFNELSATVLTTVSMWVTLFGIKPSRIHAITDRSFSPRLCFPLHSINAFYSSLIWLYRFMVHNPGSFHIPKCHPDTTSYLSLKVNRKHARNHKDGKERWNNKRSPSLSCLSLCLRNPPDPNTVKHTRHGNTTKWNNCIHSADESHQLSHP